MSNWTGDKKILFSVVGDDILLLYAHLQTGVIRHVLKTIQLLYLYKSRSCIDQHNNSLTTLLSHDILRHISVPVCASSRTDASMYFGSFAWLNFRKTPYYSHNRSFAFSIIAACVSIINALETRQRESFILTILYLSPASICQYLYSLPTPTVTRL